MEIPKGYSDYESPDGSFKIRNLIFKATNQESFELLFFNCQWNGFQHDLTQNKIEEEEEEEKETNKICLTTCIWNTFIDKQNLKNTQTYLNKIKSWIHERHLKPAMSWGTSEDQAEF